MQPLIITRTAPYTGTSKRHAPGGVAWEFNVVNDSLKWCWEASKYPCYVLLHLSLHVWCLLCMHSRVCVIPLLLPHYSQSRGNAIHLIPKRVLSMFWTLATDRLGPCEKGSSVEVRILSPVPGSVLAHSRCSINVH